MIAPYERKGAELHIYVVPGAPRALTSMHVPKQEGADDGYQNEESNNDAKVERERVRARHHI
jgi:hypothetical protein